MHPVTWLSFSVSNDDVELRSVVLQRPDGGEVIEIEKTESPKPFTEAPKVAYFQARFARIRGVEPGIWTVTATAMDERTWSKRVDLRPGYPVQLRADF